MGPAVKGSVGGKKDNTGVLLGVDVVDDGVSANAELETAVDAVFFPSGNFMTEEVFEFFFQAGKEVSFICALAFVVFRVGVEFFR